MKLLLNSFEAAAVKKLLSDGVLTSKDQAENLVFEVGETLSFRPSLRNQGENFVDCLVRLAKQEMHAYTE